MVCNRTTFKLKGVSGLLKRKYKMPIFRSEMEPIDITIKVNELVVDFCKKLKPELNAKLIDGGISILYDAETPDAEKQITCFLGAISIKKAKELGFSPLIEI
jgi:hypothetical protein